MSFSFFRVKSSSLKKDIKGLKRRETFEYNITSILDINSSNNFIS